MHRDTIVGIVGATVLVAVMVAVFVYEYNQAADANEGGGTDLDQALPPGYTNLAAGEDIDDDGIANLDDDDIDGDGTNNTRDGVVATSFAFEGSLAQGASADASHAFPAGTSTLHILGWVNVTLPAPAPIGNALGFSARLVDAEGQVVANGAPSQPAPGTTALTFTFDVPDPTPGNLTVEVARAQPGTASAYTVSMQVHYRPVESATTPEK